MSFSLGGGFFGPALVGGLTMFPFLTLGAEEADADGVGSVVEGVGGCTGSTVSEVSTGRGLSVLITGGGLTAGPGSVGLLRSAAQTPTPIKVPTMTPAAMKIPFDDLAVPRHEPNVTAGAVIIL